MDDRGINSAVEKVVVTELALDDWIMQMFGIEMGSVPASRPVTLAAEVYETFRKYYRRYQEN